uniref:Helicase ATP-binding domain-containing protein n=2 Tax=Caenorhabditis tropicalis TaxID=1561998 RepID=A0A1I7TFR7_9PELO
MMERILEAVKRKENMLCEFPAGNGKTVSLLSATCAWLQQYNEEKRAAMEKCPIHGVPEDSEDLGRDVKPVFEKEVKQEVNECGDSCLDEPPLVLLDTNPKKEEVEEKPECSCLPRVRIYYGTQSHKQIAQVVKEFALLPYANVIKHTILGSRKHLCINSEAKKQADLSSYCKKINGDNGSGCPFKTAMRPRFEKAEMMRQHLLENGSDVFDMEDLVKTLTASSPSICPYYTTNRVLTQDADLIFCPFLYLVDPLIRNSSEVHLEDAIVILDDAHHLEEACREAASFSFSEQELDETVFSFRSKRIEAEEMIKKHVDVAENENLAILKDFHVHLQFLETLSREIMYLFCRVARRGKGLTSEELFAYLNDFSIGIYLFLPPESPKYTLIKKSFETISEMKDSESRHLEMFRPSDTAISCIEKWIYFQSCFGIEQWQSSYRLNISYDRIKKPFILDSSPSTSSTSEAMKNEEIPFKTNHKALHEGYKTSLNLLCTSSSIAFSDAFRESRSVILSSESLIPMNELEEELGTEFPNKVEGESEIPPENIFAGVLTKGPSGKEIECTYMMTS